MKLLIREITREDMPYINEWRNKPEVINKLGAPFRFVNKEVDDAWFSSYLNSRANNIRLIIESKEENKPIGAVYLLGIDWVVRSGEFAIWIGEESSRGKGVGNFATRQMLAHAFDDLGMNRIHLTVLSNNNAAINLYQKFGFQVEGFLRQAAFKNGNFCDVVQMSILAFDYKVARSNC